MRHSTLLILILLLPTLLFPAQAQERTVEVSLTLERKIEVLGGRASFLFPTAAKAEARSVSIMSADPNDAQETRVVLDVHTHRVVFFAHELYKTGIPDLLAAITAADVAKHRQTKLLPDTGPLRVILSTPTTFDSTREAILVNSAVVETADHTLFQIDAYINPVAYRDRASYQVVAETVFSTAKPGIRTLPRTARSAEFKLTGGHKITFAIPADYSLTRDAKYDFEVFKFQHYQPWTDTTWRQLIIYVGSHPSMVHRDLDLTPNDARKEVGTFLTRPVEWLTFSVPRRPLVLKEQCIPADDIRKGLIFHVAMLSDQPATLADLTRLVEAIKLTP